MLTFNLDSNSKTPLYEQLYYRIRNELETGGIKSGEKLPSKREDVYKRQVLLLFIYSIYFILLKIHFSRNSPICGVESRINS